MTKQELLSKLNEIEWEDFEVKLAKGGVPKSSWESVSAFSNTAGVHITEYSDTHVVSVRTA